MNKKLFQLSYSMKKEHTKKVFKIIIFVVILLAFVNLILHFLLYPVRQTSVSMIPDIESGSMIMVTPIVSKVERGDIVLLREHSETDEGFWIKSVNFFIRFFTAQQCSPFDTSFKTQKLRRVIGVPGDTIYMRDYVMYIRPSGEKHFLTEFELIQNTYNVTFLSAPGAWDNEIGVKGSFDELTLGEGEFFVLGDNRKSADDSRLWGITNDEDIHGKALICYFPFTKFKIF